MNTREIGSGYENVALEYLKRNGYTILEQNYRCRFGEIDIIAKNNKTLCFIEVKFRKRQKYGLPGEAIDIRKQKIIYRVAEFYILKNNIPYYQECRFDAVLILDNSISLVKNAFGGI